MRRFLTPRRRLTRQKSGFRVSGQGTGSTCKIEKTNLVQSTSGKVSLLAKLPSLTIPQFFQREIGILGVGAYLYPESPCFCSCEFSWRDASGETCKESRRTKLEVRKWNKVGEIIEMRLIKKKTDLHDLQLRVLLETDADISVYGVMIGTPKHRYFIENDVYDAFKEKLSIYIPEILYLDPTTENLPFVVEDGHKAGHGHSLVCKSCNRCSRFLPIDIENERNTMSYSNHCVSRAPCSHSAFARYRIKSGSVTELPDYIQDNDVVSYFGHQLECKACKKFFVNLPLNPLRDSTQHREDSLRRRAFEMLVAELLGHEWVYHVHRMDTGTEFDVSIWKKFGRKCFNCNQPLPTPNDMDLDHTLPLAYLWPLDNTATCLCETCNSSKSDKFPVDFYSASRLSKLAKITGLPLKVLKSRPINDDAVSRLLGRLAWFFDEFLANKDYQKKRRGKIAADLIVHSLHNSLRAAGYDVNLVKLYCSETGHFPDTVSLTSE